MILALIFSQQLHAAEINFEKVDIKIGKIPAHVQIADDDEKREHGLMFVKQMPPNEGMLFVFDVEHDLAFWMKNTLIPLSIGFFDDHGVLVDVQEMKPASSLMETNPPIYASAKPATLALEMNAGWFKKNRLVPGAKISLASSAKSALLKRKVPASTGQTSSGTQR